MSDIVSVETIAGKIYIIRSLNVMLDRELAELYRVLKQNNSKERLEETLIAFLLILCSNLQKKSWSIGGAKLAPPIVIR